MEHASAVEGVAAVIVRAGRLLVIQRSHLVVAPGAYCFPGGAIEAGETEAQALVREIQEELSVPVRPLRRIWSSVTPWHVSLAWWTASLADDLSPAPNPAEVAAVHWYTTREMAALPGLLESNYDFLAALDRGEIDLDELILTDR